MNNNNILDISFYQIQLFLAVARERNFSKAAERMSLSQPSLSKRITYIEDMLGVKLFDRDQRPIALTGQGQVLFEAWEKLLQGYEDSVDRMLRGPVREKTLTLALIDSSGPEITPMLTTGTQMELEEADFTFHWEYVRYPEFREKLHNGEADLAFVSLLAANNHMENLDWFLLESFPKITCMLKTNPLAEKESITMDDLKEQRFVVLSPAELPGHYQLVKHYCNAHGYEPKIARYAPNANALVSCLRENNEVLICDRFLRGADYRHLKRFVMQEIRSGIVAVWKKGNPNPMIRPYLARLQENMRKLGAGAFGQGT